MTTIINTPPNNSNDEGIGVGLILGILLAAAVVGTLFFVYGLPMLQGGGGEGAETQKIEIQVPAATPEVTTP